MAETPAGRLAALRAELARQGLAGFIVPRADEHLGEYVPACAERLAFLTGFSGSAGVAAILPDKAAVFTDGRYTLQLAAETDAELWECRHVTDDPPQRWLAANAPPGAHIGYDPMLISEEGLARYTEAGLAMIAVAENPVDAIWQHRPPPAAAPVYPHPLEYAGRTSAEKRGDIANALRSAKHDAAVITDPASIAWLLNIRGGDLPYTPVGLGFGLIRADGRVDVFMQAEKIPPETRAWLGNEVSVWPREAMTEVLAGLRGRTARVDPAGSPVWFAQELRRVGASVANGTDPCSLPKACKNPVEQQGAREAHLRDGIALCRFLHFISLAAPEGGETEMSAAARLLACRQEAARFQGESFPAISSAGEHGAIIHYRVAPASDRPIRPNEIYLIDSGGQYEDGTTDITRAVWTGPDDPPHSVREHFTRVLKGHIAIATLRFPSGLAGPHLDAFARRALWDIGLDYDHGTGHGVGSFLSVHEGPVSLSRLAKPVALAPGMILSDEPGLYIPGQYGIRLENLLLVQAAELAQASKPFLSFEVLSLAPFDRRLIAPALLDAGECAWLNAYHARVLALIGPILNAAERAWLEGACAPIL
ncbi:MAG: aminopeptidase P family protein [Acetobacteraceae bacterium]|nr:aminopeptidase P family protein [Acetobacteraceae bacterium]